MLARGRQSGLLVLGDALWILAAVPLAALIRLGPNNAGATTGGFLLGVGALNACIFLAAFYYNDLYELRTLAQERALIVRVARSLAAGMVLVALAYYALPSLQDGRGILLLTAALVAGYAYASRTALKVASQAALHERILILGAAATAQEIGREIAQRRKMGYDLVGFLDRPDGAADAPVVLGTFEDLAMIAERERIDKVLVCVKDRRECLPFEQLLQLRLNGVEVEDGATFWEKLTGKVPVRDITPSWFIFGPGFRQPKMTLAMKRALDVVVSIFGILVTGPAMLATALAIRIDSPGPIFFQQERVGLKGRGFKLVKFRSMRADAESKSGPVWAQANDDRITRVGRFIRKTRLDELPQFWNVLKGDMSLVGPRPERPFFVQQLAKSIPYYELRHVVRPGCTGWAQVKYRYGASEEDSMQKLQYDLHYIKYLSIRRDLLVMFDTLKVMTLGEGR